MASSDAATMSSESPKSGLSKSRQGAASVSTNRAGSDREASPGWEELVRGCAKGDSAALSALYDQTSSLVYGVALRVLSNPADAEEITIDVYTQVWRTAANFENTRGSVTAWLIMLARSRAIDRIRSRAHCPVVWRLKVRWSVPETKIGQLQRFQPLLRSSYSLLRNSSELPALHPLRCRRYRARARPYSNPNLSDIARRRSIRRVSTWFYSGGEGGIRTPGRVFDPTTV